MMKFSLKNFLENILDVIEDIFAIIIASAILLVGWFVDKELFRNDPLLWSAVIGILIIMAIGNLRDRRRRFRKIHQTVDKTLHEIQGNKIIEVSGADHFFNADEDSIQEHLKNAKTVDIVGITFSTSVGKTQQLIKERLKYNTNIRIIILDNDSNDALKQLVKKSWSKKASKEKYLAMIDNTIDLLEEIGNESDLTGSFKIGYLPFIPTVGMTLINSKFNSAVGLITVYHQLKKSSQVFLIKRNDDPVTFDFYTEQFELMWSECEINKVKNII